MPSYGLLGAAAGFGQALVTVGQGLEQRRQQALEQARREAEHQRRRQETLEDRQATQSFQVQMFRARETGLDERSERSAIASDKRQARGFENQSRLQEDRQDHASQLQRERLQEQERMTRLRAALARSNSEAAARLRDALDDDNVTGVLYGETNAAGQSRVILRRQDGTLVRTNDFVARRAPRTAADDEDEDEDF